MVVLVKKLNKYKGRGKFTLTARTYESSFFFELDITSCTSCLQSSNRP